MKQLLVLVPYTMDSDPLIILQNISDLEEVNKQLQAYVTSEEPETVNLDWVSLGYHLGEVSVPTFYQPDHPFRVSHVGDYEDVAICDDQWMQDYKLVFDRFKQMITELGGEMTGRFFSGPEDVDGAFVVEVPDSGREWQVRVTYDENGEKYLVEGNLSEELI